MYAALNPLDSTSLLSSAGAVGVFLVLFAETGLLVGFFLPGDSLLFTAGLLCTAHAGDKVHLSLPPVLVAAVAGAIGSSIPGVDRYLLPIVGVIVVVSLAPVALEVRRGRRAGVSSGPRDRDGAVDR
ncbi:hypothetical protein ABZ914_10970 [Spirillospora sp. NPDC046719]